MADDDAIVEAIRVELDEGLRLLAAENRFDGHVTVSTDRRFATTIVELTGRFINLADREVSGIVEIDPARIGWRIEASLWTQLDTAEMQEMTRDLGSARVVDAGRAVELGRGLARSVRDAMLELVSP
jgi:hypothetical protein